ncbi:MAG: hypothetical protein ACRDRL_13175 [Sciscionella sp.]
MSDVGVICARASSLQKLQRELDRLLAGRSADEVPGVSHFAAPVSSRQSGGVWGGSRTEQKLEYSAVVLVRGQ